MDDFDMIQCEEVYDNDWFEDRWDDECFDCEEGGEF